MRECRAGGTHAVGGDVPLKLAVPSDQFAVIHYRAPLQSLAATDPEPDEAAAVQLEVALI